MRSKTTGVRLRCEPLEVRWLLASSVAITEVVPLNQSSLRDEDGDTSDWVEIHNASDEAVDLNGWSLTDDPQDPTKWSFGSVRIAPRGYLVVFASGKDRAPDSARLQRDFNSTPGGTFLIDLEDGTYQIRLTIGDVDRVRDEIAVTIQDQLVDVLEAGAGEFVEPTYEAQVSAATSGQLRLRLDDRGGATSRVVINALTVTSATGETVRRLDFGTSQSPVEPGFVRVAGNVYATEAGWGWQQGTIVGTQDRGARSDEQHASFRLRSTGEYLGLIEANGTTVASEFSPVYPPLRADVSYGLPQPVVEATAVTDGSPVTVLVPTVENDGDALGTTWTRPDFDDTSWIAGTNGVGYERQSGYESLIRTDIEAAMFGVNTSAYVRAVFDVEDAHEVYSTSLRLKYDAGFVAYLNGVEVARRNAPASPDWDSSAGIPRDDAEAVQFEDINLVDAEQLLRDGRNVLAVHGLAPRFGGDEDFLIVPELVLRRPGALSLDSSRFLPVPSPAAPSGSVSFAGLTEPTRVSRERALSDAGFDVVITSSTPGASIVYTTDGSRPSPTHGTSVPAAGPDAPGQAIISIAHTAVLQSIAYKDDWMPSEIDVQTYIFPSDVRTQDETATLDAGFPAQWGLQNADYGMDPDVVSPDDLFQGRFAAGLPDALRGGPTVSITMDLDDLFGTEGIYANPTRRGIEWERPVSLEWIDPNQGEQFRVEAGIRILGGLSRTAADKKSFRLEFRGQYGTANLEFPVFGGEAASQFDALILRAGFNDSWVWTAGSSQYVRDEWMRSTLLEIGHPNAHGRFVHVYLNGFYWGLYNLVERPEANFSSMYFGGDSEEWDALNSGRASDGTDDAWGQLRQLAGDVRSPDRQASNAALQRLLGNHPDGSPDPARETLLDITNYIDYLIVNFYSGNTDWPDKNYYVGRRRGPESTGFKFYSWDAERSLNDEEGAHVNVDITEVSSGVASAYGQLQANHEFRLMFADRVHKHFFNGGALYVDPENPQWDPDHPDRNMPATRYAQLVQQVEGPLVAESARWGDAERDAVLYTVDHWRGLIEEMYEDYLPQRSAIVLDQLVAAGLYPELDAPVFSQHGGEVAEGLLLSMDAPGDIYFTLDGTDPRLATFGREAEGAAPSATARKYSGAIAIDGDTVVKARTLLDGQWSALNEAVFEAAPLPLRISEIMYHPSDPGAGSAFGDDDDFEFIEVVNVSPTATIDLEGVSFTDGISFTFPQMPLGPGEHAVVARHQEAFVERYGDGIPLAGQYGTPPDDFRLNNGGETVQLEDAEGNVLQVFAYRDDWHPTTDGQGYSLEMVDPASADLGRWGRADGWLPSLAAGGTPGGPRSSGPVTIGDLDLNGQIDQDDIAALVLGLKSPGDYASRYGVPAELAGDMDQDGDLDYDDIAGFLQRLAPPGVAATAERAADAVFTGGFEPPPARPGDWDGDGDVDFDDIARRPRSHAAAPNRLLVRALKRR